MRTRIACIALFTGLAACSSEQAYTVEFDALVGGEPFSCTQSYSGIGTTMTTIQPLDFRMYVHDLTLVRSGGETVPLTLEDDGVWQNEGVALLDFEDGTGTCMTNSPQTNIKVTGHAPAHGDYDGLTFTVGVPAAQDHLNVISAVAPLNDPLMFWSWTGGYKYLKLEVKSTGQADFYFHLGAQDCSGANTSVSCTYPNLASIPLSGFSMGVSHVALDLANLYSTSNLDAQPDMTNPVAGCMSIDGADDCPPLFAKLGLTFPGSPTAPAQTFFEAK
jgi:uncharacterized repeat protein (TIGR04052 family)